jgi:hypothetical protein
MVSQPIPIAVRLASGITLRGHEWSEDGPPVLFVHDLGGDLDDWGSTPATLARSGFRVISVELRGHGLSDGEPDPSLLVDDVMELVGEVAGPFGPVALVACGSVSEAALYLSKDVGSPVQIMVSPQPLDPAGIDWPTTSYALRLLAVGANNETAHGYARDIYPKMHGQNLWASTGTTDQGPALLAEHPSMVEQVVMFIRRYLTGHHLAWIAEHVDEIKSSADESDS